MLYHKFRTDTEPNIIGVKDGLNQVEILPDGYADKAGFQELQDYFDFRTYWQQKRTSSPTFTVEYAKLRLEAKLTDFLGMSPFLMGCPFMLSRRAKEVFARHFIQPSFFFDAFIYDKTGLVSNEFSLFYLPVLGYEVIDFPKSRFYATYPVAKPLSFANADAYEEYRNTQNRIPSVESLVMSDAFDTKLDFFQCRLGPLFMSERLKRAIEEAGLSNAVFPPAGPLAFAE